MRGQVMIGMGSRIMMGETGREEEMLVSVEYGVFGVFGATL